MNKLTPEQVNQIVSSLPGVLQDEPMAKHTNFRIGGPARLYYVASDADALMHAVGLAKEKGMPWFVFGGGSNLLVSDDGYQGLAIQAALRNITVADMQITCGSGVITGMAARKAADAGLGGFEWAIGVPGTIGGAVYGNAGCYGGEMKDVVTSVDAYRMADGQRVSYTNAECQFGYRESRFKHEPHIILGCTLTLTSGNREASLARMKEIVSMRKVKQPLEQSSAGCAFKNFAFSDVSALDLLKRAADVPEEMVTSGKISAGWLVEKAGLLGKRVGDIAVSDKHGNFLVNLGGGRAQDVIALMSLVKMKVRDDLGILLEDEVQLVGF